MRLCYLTSVLFVFLASPCQAQYFGPIMGLFDKVNSVSIHYGRSFLLSESTEQGDVVFGDRSLNSVGMEVYLDLPAPSNLSFELGLGTRYGQGLESAAQAPSLSLTLRSLPNLAFYAAYTREIVEPYVGTSFGITSLWNASGTNRDGVPFDVTATTYDFGFSGGLAFDLESLGLGPVGLYAEVGTLRRLFGSVSYTSGTPGATLPAAWPHQLDLSSLYGTVGLQVDLQAETATSFAGSWLLRSVDGQAIPAMWHLEDAGPSTKKQETIVGGHLTLDPAEGGRGRYTLTAYVRSYTLGSDGVMTSADSAAVAARTLAAGRYAADGSTLVLYPASGREETEAYLDGSTLVVFAPVTGHVFAFERAGP